MPTGSAQGEDAVQSRSEEVTGAGLGSDDFPRDEYVLTPGAHGGDDQCLAGVAEDPAGHNHPMPTAHDHGDDSHHGHRGGGHRHGQRAGEGEHNHGADAQRAAPGPGRDFDVPLLPWSGADQAELRAHPESLEMMVAAFVADVSDRIADDPQLRALIDQNSTVERHRQLMLEHLAAMTTVGPQDEDVQVRSRRMGRTHIANGVRPSWYVLLYNRWFAAVHKVEAVGVDIPPLETMRRLWQWDLSMSLDAYHEGMLNRWDVERGELEETVTTFRRLASTDPLTGLANRPALAELIDNFSRRGGKEGFLVLLDLDHFKNLNDRMGHPAGDRALRVIGKALAGSVRRSDAVARIGGDEFCLWFPQAGDETDLWEQIRRIMAGLPLSSLDIGVSAGTANFPADGTDFRALYRAADRRLYATKRAGKGGMQMPSGSLLRWADSA